MAKQKEQTTKVGRVSISDLKSLLNKKAGLAVAHDLNEDNPTVVKQWIPTGSTWLDSIICRGKKTGIPVGKIVELAGLEATRQIIYGGANSRQCPKNGYYSGIFR